MRYSETFTKAHVMGINRLAVGRMRARYLFDWIDDCLEEGGDLALLWAQEALNEIEYLQEHAFYEPPPSTRTQSLTLEQIDAARHYPIERLISFDRSGRATAFCHPDRNPSLTWFKKRNRATCFPCWKSYGPIDVLIERDHFSFNEAVRSLL